MNISISYDENSVYFDCPADLSRAKHCFLMDQQGELFIHCKKSKQLTKITESGVETFDYTEACDQCKWPLNPAPYDFTIFVKI